MHFHLPKPLHGWREFAGEVGIIVVGVLIALMAEQIVETAHWSAKVADARRRLAPELGEDLGQGELLNRSRACTERRLDQLAAIVAAAQQTGRLPQIGDISQPYWFTWDMGIWQSLVADQTATHFDRDDLTAYTSTYQFILGLDDASKQQMQTWTTLSGLSGPGRPFDTGEANFYLQAITHARFLSRFISGVAIRAQQNATAYRLPINQDVFHSYADLDAGKWFCAPLPATGSISYGQAPWKDVVERMRAHPITRDSNGM